MLGITASTMTALIEVWFNYQDRIAINMLESNIDFNAVVSTSSSTQEEEQRDSDDEKEDERDSDGESSEASTSDEEEVDDANTIVDKLQRDEEIELDYRKRSICGSL